ncbi:hypothetical protein S83_023774, partial [Arachis hypogaea]
DAHDESRFVTKAPVLKDKRDLNLKCTALSPHFQEHSSLPSILLSLLSPLQLNLAASLATLHQCYSPPFSSKVCVKSHVSYFVVSNRVAPSISATVVRAATPFVTGVVSLLHRPAIYIGCVVIALICALW